MNAGYALAPSLKVRAACSQASECSKLAGLLQFRTLWCKLLAVTFSMGGGLIAGKDGPLIHTGGIVGGGLGKLSPRCGTALHHLMLRCPISIETCR